MSFINIAIVFGQFGPYHYARVSALQEFYRCHNLLQSIHYNVIPVQLASATSTYEWNSEEHACSNLVTFFDSKEEDLSFLQVFQSTADFIVKYNIKVVFVPSYYPARYTAVLLASHLLQVKVIMMNESHKHTERAKGFSKFIKKVLIRSFHAALVGGSPHKQYFSDMGLDSRKIFTGYDSIDNDYFSFWRKSITSYQESLHSSSHNQDTLSHQFDPIASHIALNREFIHSYNLRELYGLPSKYFLSLGRLVEKKNIENLLSAYSLYCRKANMNGESNNSLFSLVIVGSGPLDSCLRDKANGLSLRVFDMSNYPSNNEQSEFPLNSLNEPSVYFYGFRQINENPVFYSLANAFVLPSLWEEWGLVVNEAMASSLPVIVSNTSGCSYDLLEPIDNIPKGTINFTVRDSLSYCVNGFTFNPHSIEALSNALLFISIDKDRALLMGKNSFNIISRYSCQAFAYNAHLAVSSSLQKNHL